MKRLWQTKTYLEANDSLSKRFLLSVNTLISLSSCSPPSASKDFQDLQGNKNVCLFPEYHYKETTMWGFLIISVCGASFVCGIWPQCLNSILVYLHIDHLLCETDDLLLSLFLASYVY